MNKWFIALACLACFLFEQASASTLYPTLKLASIAQIKTSEKHGDEIYWVLTEFKSSNKKNVQYTIPEYPLHWPSKGLKQIANVNLWQGKLADGQSSILYLELVEHDAPPFNTDDSMGAMRLVVRNDRGHLNIDWQNSENVDHDQSKNGALMVEKLRFHGAGGDYLVTMHFDELEKP